MSTARHASPDVLPALAELRARAQWVLWRRELREGDDKPTKVPYQPNGRKALTNAPSTWAPYATCVAALEREDFAGLGYVFASDDPYVGVDLDHCLDDQGHPSARALEIVDALRSYTERSQSGRLEAHWPGAEFPKAQGLASAGASP
jgi:putative DNA primase/helicase